ncbi:MAG: ABC transporter substrate-binding protein [Deltaproteobacteria bacterium]|nr:ABC transporter substrate-binding protein [Deltaproteobacteria bacterium]
MSHPPRATLALAVAAALLLASACDRSPASGGRRRAGGPTNRLVNAVLSDPKTFNPVLVTDATSSDVLRPIFEGLVDTDVLTTLPRPQLAERWEWSADGKICTFHLRRDVHWHDGRPLRAADVVFTFDAVFDEKVPNSARFTLTVAGQPVRPEAVDEHTVRFVLPQPFAPFLSAVGIGILPEHILGHALREGRFAETWGIDTPPEQLVGTGPYRLRRYESAQYLEYARNDGYWRRDDAGERLPYLERRVTLIVPEQNAASLRFLDGQTHYYAPRPEEIADLQDRAAQLGIVVAEVGVDSGTLFIAFNRNPRRYADGDPRLAWFTDRRFLTALAHAVDKQGMIDTIYYGFGEPAVAYISPANPVFHNPDLKDHAYDLELAARLLDEAGYVDRDGDGFREDPQGNRIEFGLVTNAGNLLRERMCSILQDDWTRLGLKINYRPQTFQSLVERLTTTFDWDAVIMGFTGSLDPNNGANLLRSSGNLHLWNPAQKTPATPWEAEIDRLLDEGAAELDLEKRRRAYFRIQAILHEELPLIETVRQRQAMAYSADLRAFVPTVWGLYEPERIRIAAPAGAAFRE